MCAFYSYEKECALTYFNPFATQSVDWIKVGSDFKKCWTSYCEKQTESKNIYKAAIPDEWITLRNKNILQENSGNILFSTIVLLIALL